MLEQQQHVGDGAVLAGVAQPALGDAGLLVGDEAAADNQDFGAHSSKSLHAPRSILVAAPMVQSKALRPDWLPAVALSALLAALMLAWNPQVGDLAAQVFRTELFQHTGLAIWNGSWYGGHYTLTYSVLFPPLASLLSPQLVGTLSVVASSYFFDRLVRDRWGEAARWATLWFAAGVVTLLADGQLTFALGVAFGLASLRALQTRRVAKALLASAACALSSPVAAVFLAGTDRRLGLHHRLAPSLPWQDPRSSALGPQRVPPSSALDRSCRPRPDPDPKRTLPERRPVPLRLLLLHRDPALVRFGALRDAPTARRGASAALGDRRLPAGLDRDLAGAQPDGR